MISSWWSKIKLYLPLLTIVLVALWVTIINIKPGTTLSGWDTLQPELNLTQYFQRTFWGAWQPHQGLGAPASQAHLAEIVRLPIVWLLQIFPNNLNRYLFFFICYVTGGIGVYYFLTLCFLRQTKFTTWPAAAAAVFYLLNLITLQQFYVPLEMFAVHFATLPWVFLTLQKAVERGRLQEYFWFFVVLTLAAPAAHTATLFYMYLPFVFLYTFFLLWAKRGGWRKKIKAILILIFLVLAANSYWLLPNFYYSIFHSHYVSKAKISQNFSPEAFWNNQAYGWLPQVLTGKNFLFNWKDLDWQKGEFVPLFDEWNSYYQKTHLFFLQYVFVIIAFAGIYKSWKKQTWQTLALLAVFLGSLFFLINLNFPLKWLYQLIRSLPLLKEAIRFPFTKFSIIYLFALVVFFANGLVFIQELLTKKWETKRTITTTVNLLAITLLLLAHLPALTGHLMSDKMKVTFPKQYDELYSFLTFLNQEQVVVKLPMLSYSGWTYHDWQTSGYQGAGWLWFGLPQALLDREFDRWVNTNETVYRQLNLALNQENESLFSQVLQQYNLSLFLLDESAFINEGKGAQYQEIKDFLSASGGQLIWQKDFLSLYQFYPEAALFKAADKYSLVNNKNIIAGQRDFLYENSGDYLLSKTADLTYPFAFLTTEQNEDLVRWHDQTVVLKGEKITQENMTLTLPALADNETYITPVRLSFEGGNLLLDYPRTYINNGKQKIEIPQLQNMEIDISSVGAERVMVEFNQEVVFLAQGESKVAVFQFLPNKNQKITVVDDRKINAQERTEKISYIINYQNAFSYTFTPNYLEPLKKTTSLVLEEANKNLELVIDRSFEQAVDLKQKMEIGNCSQEGEVENLNAKNEAKLWLRAEKMGNACLTIRAENFNNGSDYLLRMKGQNLAGRSWKMAVIQDSNGQRFLETLLPEGDFDITYNLMSQNKKNYQELFFNFETNSFGQKSENTLTELIFIPVNIQRLGKIYAQQRNLAKVSSVAQIGAYHKNNSASYELTFAGQSENNLLVFHQSYDPLWRAKFINQETGEKIVKKPQVFNGWANAWTVDRGQWLVKIYYWPQIWAYGGMILWLGTLAGFGYLFWQDRKKEKRNLRQIVRTLFG